MLFMHNLNQLTEEEFQTLVLWLEDHGLSLSDILEDDQGMYVFQDSEKEGGWRYVKVRIEDIINERS